LRYHPLWDAQIAEAMQQINEVPQALYGLIPQEYKRKIESILTGVVELDSILTGVVELDSILTCYYHSEM